MISPASTSNSRNHIMISIIPAILALIGLGMFAAGFWLQKERDHSGTSREIVVEAFAPFEAPGETPAETWISRYPVDPR